MTTYVVRTSAASMPSSCWGEYRHVAVMEIDPERTPHGGPTMISTRARGVIRIVQEWRALNVGRCVRSAYAKVLIAAEEMADRLNERARQRPQIRAMKVRMAGLD